MHFNKANDDTVVDDFGQSFSYLRLYLFDSVSFSLWHFASIRSLDFIAESSRKNTYLLASNNSVVILILVVMLGRLFMFAKF